MTWEVLASGYELAEAPRVARDGSVWFTDVLGGGVYRWDGGAVETVVPKRRGVGGLALHVDGGVVVSGRDVVHVGADGTNRTLWTPPDGVTGLNDLCALVDGSILVGALAFRPFAGESPVPGAFWMLGPRGQAAPFIDDVDWPNGCGADAARTYACDYSRGLVHVLGSDGAHERWATPSGEADGLAVDEEGGVWVAEPRASSIVRFTPEGVADQSLEVSGHTPSSLAFDGDTMYVTTIAGRDQPGALLRGPAPVAGVRHHLAMI